MILMFIGIGLTLILIVANLIIEKENEKEREEMANINDFDCCPHCGAEEYYVKMRVIGSITNNFYRFDGEEAENSHIHDGLSYKTFKKAYCSECDKYIGKVEEQGA